MWYAHNHRLAPGETVPVTFKGTTSLYVEFIGARVTCSVKGAETITNPAEGFGTNEITELSFHSCAFEYGEQTARHKVCPKNTKIELTAEDLPWKGQLTFYLGDAVEGVHLLLDCTGGLDAEEITGMFDPLVGYNKLIFGLEEGNVLSDYTIITGTWLLEGPTAQKAITALLAPEA